MATKRDKLNEAAAAMGRKGGRARAEKLTKAQRVEIARLGGKATKGIPKKKARSRGRTK